MGIPAADLTAVSRAALNPNPGIVWWLIHSHPLQGSCPIAYLRGGLNVVSNGL
jgi:hypothetical protein